MARAKGRVVRVSTEPHQPELDDLTGGQGEKRALLWRLPLQGLLERLRLCLPPPQGLPLRARPLHRSIVPRGTEQSQLYVRLCAAITFGPQHQ